MASGKGKEGHAEAGPFAGRTMNCSATVETVAYSDTPTLTLDTRHSALLLKAK